MTDLTPAAQAARWSGHASNTTMDDCPICAAANTAHIAAQAAARPEPSPVPESGETEESM